MNVKRTATIVVAGGAVAAWLSAAMTPQRGGASFPAVKPAAIDSRGTELANEIVRLHERLRPEATPREPSRNLFTFRATAARSRLPAAPTPAMSESVMAAAPMLMALRLAGLAEDPGPDGPIRTAVISGEGQLFLVKEGENVTSRYRVARISADLVELTDLGDGSTRVLVLNR